MSKITILEPSWREWIVANLRRCCSQECLPPESVGFSRFPINHPLELVEGAHRPEPEPASAGWPQSSDIPLAGANFPAGSQAGDVMCSFG